MGVEDSGGKDLSTLASAWMGQECAYDLGEVFQIGGCQPFMHWQKERLFAVENAGLNTVLLDESF